jgi:glycine/D-amino acid oxidase-like deaminating enzyme
MHTVVLGAGALGVATAHYLSRLGHRVTVIERQPGAALETSFGNGAVIHASEVEPWSQPGMPLKILKWLGREDAPMLLRLKALPHILRWGPAFLANCTEARFVANARRHDSTWRGGLSRQPSACGLSTRAQGAAWRPARASGYFHKPSNRCPATRE